jgi:5'-nucleotidase
VGNHEFDFGPAGPGSTPKGPSDDPRGALKARAAQARFPFLAANLIDQGTGRPVSWPNVQPSVVVDVAGIRVGIVGLLTSETLATTMTANTRGLTIAPLAATLAAEAARLRRAGATVIVATAHAGGACTSFSAQDNLSSCDLSDEIFDVAMALPPGAVDAIVSGHRHSGIAHVVSGTAIVEAYSSGRAFGRIDLQVDVRSKQVTGKKVFAPHEVCSKANPDTGACTDATSRGAVDAAYEGRPVVSSAEVEKVVASAVAEAAQAKGRALGATIEGDFPDVNARESALGNLITDWMRAARPDVDVAVWNAGGIRAPLPAGALTYGRLYEVVPFDDLEAVLTIPGAALREVVARNLQDKNSVIELSGVTVAAACEGATLGVVLSRPNGARVMDDERVTVVTSDFLATGGSGIFSPAIPFDRPPVITDETVRDRMAEWIAKTGGTWRSSVLFDPARPRLVYPGARPVRCAAPR